MLTTAVPRMAKKFADMVSSYRFDISKAPGAKVGTLAIHDCGCKEDVGRLTRSQEAQGITETPCALVYKDGQRVAKADGMKPPSMQEISQMVSGSS